MPQDSARISDVPTNIITGFFGAGKTTAIRALFERRPAGEKWAVLVNEFGDVPIDQAAMETKPTDEIVIREIAGGCMCCTMNLPMRVGVTEILRQARPDRLLIEPTGLGHPAGIIDELRNPPLSAAIDLQAVICLVDPRFIGDARIQDAPVFRDQIQIADVLVANKADLAAEDDIARFQDWASALFPPKDHVVVVEQGAIEISLLDRPSGVRRVPLYPDLHDHAHGHDHDHAAAVAVGDPPEIGHPSRFENQGNGYCACGWVFADAEIFDLDRLVSLLSRPGLPGFRKGDPVERLKGLFRTQTDWVLVDRSRSEVTVNSAAYRRDSRVEVIVPATAAPDWPAFEAALLDCILTGQPAD